MQKNFFSSDYHLGHGNVIKYDNRPFANVDEMDETIIANHNRVVGPYDNFFYMGDFTFNKSKAEEYMQRLNGVKYFVRGNHDDKAIVDLYKKYGQYLGGLAEIKVEGQRIVLCHYAMDVWNRSHHGTWHLFGHSHHPLPVKPNSKRMDVGINGIDYNYTPLEFSQIKVIMDQIEFIPIDHHDRKSR